MTGVDLSRFRKKVFYPIPRRVAWMFVQATAFRLSPRPLWGWRAFLLRLFGARIGRGVKLDSTCSVWDPRKLTLGDHCWVGPFVELYTVDTITVGDNVALAQHALLYTASHDIEDPEFPTTHAPIVIHDQAWVAADTFVGPGVTIGQGAVLGARASAFKDLPPWTVCVGTPAVPVRARTLRTPVGEPHRA